MEKSNGELFAGCEQIKLAKENMERDWNSGEVRLPAEVVQKKQSQVKQAKEDLVIIGDLLEKFEQIALKK